MMRIRIPAGYNVSGPHSGCNEAVIVDQEAGRAERRSDFVRMLHDPMFYAVWAFIFLIALLAS